MRTLFLILAVSSAAVAATPSKVEVREGFVEMEVRTVAPVEGSNAVLLVPRIGEDLILPIFIGDAEASAIQLRLTHQTAPRPMTHDLLETMIKTLGGRVVKIEVDDLKNNIYLGTIYVQQGDKTLTIDARPSDSIALALGTGAPIHAARKVLDEAGVKGNGQQKPETPGQKHPKSRTSAAPHETL